MNIRRPAVLALLLIAAACTPKGPDRGLPESVVRDNILGTAYLGQQKWAEAEAAFRSGLEAAPDEPVLLNNLGIALAQQGRAEEADAEFGLALDREPNMPWAHYNLGLSLKGRGEFEAAVSHFEAVAAVDPDDLLTQYNLGVVLSRVGRGEEAEAAFRRALERNPAHVSTLYALGRQLLQRGEAEEGARLLELSQAIRERSGLDEAVGSQYGEQGPYAMGVDFPGDGLAAPGPVAFRFEPGAEVVSDGEGFTLAPTVLADGRPAVRAATAGSVTTLVGDDWSAAVPLTIPDDAVPVRWIGEGDLDGNGSIDLVLLADAADGGLVAFTAVVAEGGDDGARRWDGPHALTSGTEDASIEGTLVDQDHDGDLDLFVCWVGAQASGCALGVNDGSGVMDGQPGDARGLRIAATGDGPVSVGFSDFDNDRDIDLIAAGPDGLHVFSNERDGNFVDVRETAGLADGARGLTDFAVADLDKDGWMDLVTAGGGDGLAVRFNRRGRFAPMVRPFGTEKPAESLVVADLDNDGFLDVAAGDAGSPPFVVRNLGLGEWNLVAAAAEGLEPGAPRLAGDADGDGDLDLYAIGANGPVAWRNTLGGGRRWIGIDSRGVADNRSGIGAKVEVLAGGLRQKMEVTDPWPLHLGLDDRQQVESVRYLWPSGVLQDEIEQPTAKTVEITQLDRKGTSCPLLYAWRDGDWRFVTDFLGGCAVGYLHAPGIYSTPDTDEYVKIEGGLDPDAEGRYRIRLNNQLQEVIWFDQAELVVVDHPSGTTVYPNERLMPGPPWPEFALFASETIRPVAAARGIESGRDLGPALAERDREFADDFVLRRFKGYAEPHTLELDLGPLPRGRRIVLLLDGWIDYADSSANLAAHQAGLVLAPPRLTVADGRGGWRETGHRMGFPAGLPKTMAVELTGLFRADDTRIRIATNMRIYWDRARVMIGGEATPLIVHRLRPSDAELRFGGFPAETSPDGGKPFAYDPRQVSLRSPWKAHVGGYTPFGDVRDRLSTVDDRLVTTRSGDEIELRFESPGPVAEGFRRTFLLYADGFGKDMDPNSAASDRVGPVPFHGMPTYPYDDGVTAPAAGATAEGEAPLRRVLDSPRGWPGAVPQVLVARED